jgi:hypothetical protein
MEDDNDKTYVKIVSADGPEFFIERRIALQVDTMKAMLEGNFRESEEGGEHSLHCPLNTFILFQPFFFVHDQ